MIKKTIFYIIFIFISIIGNSQFTFQHVFRSPLHQVPGYIIEGEDGDIVLSIITANPKESKIIKINNYGSITDSVIINKVPNYFLSLTKYDSNSFFIAGVKFCEVNDTFWLRKYDFDFNLMKEISIPVEGKILFSNFIIMIVNNNNNLVITFLSSKSDYDARTYIVEVNQDCEIVRSKIFLNNTFVDFTCAIIQKNNYYYFFVSGWYNNKGMLNIYKLDLEFNSLGFGYLATPYDMAELNNAKWINDSIFLLSGKYFNWTTHFYETKVVKIKIDTALHPFQYIILKDNDSSVAIARTNLDFINVNNIFVGSWMYKYVPMYYDHVSTQFVLTKIDSALNIIWMKKYGGDVHWMLDVIKATQDGGCVMGGTYYGPTQTDEKDPFLMKVDGNGNISWVHNLPDDFIKFTVYPNPGSNEMTVNNPPQHTKIILYDLSGKKQKEQELDVNNTVNTEDLKAGIYFYQVIDDKGTVVAKGKWVKG